ncbi:MAG: DUF4197 domain-containing protein [Chitinophagaceae bacterium]
MKKIITFSIAAIFSLSSFAQKDSASSSRGFGGLLKKANTILNKSGNGSSLSSDEIVKGLKEALSLGAQKSAGKLSSVDGFLKDAAVKILLPDDVKKLEPKIRALGLGKYFDQAITSMNRAAEEASKTASPIFISAVKKMTIQDALGILKGNDTAATTYLKNTTSNELTNSFRPVIDSAMKKVNATKYWSELATVYNRFSPQPLTTDLNEYVTSRALKGMFYYVGEEEKKIRENPAARVSDVLKKVFGAK